MDYSVITWFRNKTPTFHTFRKFYTDVWGVNEFIYIVGYDTKKDKEFIVRHYVDDVGSVERDLTPSRDSYFSSNKDFLHAFKAKLIMRITGLAQNIEFFIKEDAGSGVRSVFLLYKTRTSKDPMIDFLKVKSFFNEIFIKQLLDKSRHYLGVDDDEFLYSTDIQKLKKRAESGEAIRFHFVELICGNEIFLKEWSWQSWFSYRIERGDPSYNCDSCISYNVRSDLRPFGTFDPFWVHSSSLNFSGSSCESLKLSQKMHDGLLGEVMDRGICFHVPALTYPQLVQIKHQNRFRTNSGKNIGNYGLELERYNLTRTYFDVFLDGTIERLLDQRDVALHDLTVKNIA